MVDGPRARSRDLRLRERFALVDARLAKHYAWLFRADNTEFCPCPTTWDVSMASCARRFTILDAMLLVAAAACGIAVERATDYDLNARLVRAGTLGGHIVAHLDYAQSKYLPFAVTGTIALMVARLVPPRASFPRLSRQPGAVACFVATLTISILAAWVVSVHFFKPARYHRPFSLWLYSLYVSFAVIGGWSSLALSGRWRAEPSWVDRVGRFMGIIWIGTLIVVFSREYLTAFL